MNAARQLELPLDLPTSRTAIDSDRASPTVPDAPREEALFRSPTASKFPFALPLTVAASTTIDRRRTQREIISHHWECTVLSVGATSFAAALRSLRDPIDSEKEADIPIEAVTPDDVELLEAGAIFYWTIGYEISAGGTRRRTSQLKFRRLPAWTKKDIARVRERGKELFEMFGEPVDERNAASR